MRDDASNVVSKLFTIFTFTLCVESFFHNITRQALGRRKNQGLVLPLPIGSSSTHNSTITNNGILSTPPQTILTLHHQIKGEEGYESMQLSPAKSVIEFRLSSAVIGDLVLYFLGLCVDNE